MNPLQASRYRERHAVSGAKSDGADAHMLADMVRTDSHQLRAVAGDSADAEGVKVLARTHKTLIWERIRQTQRLRHQFLEYFPAALDAFDDLDAPDTLELLGNATDPARAPKLTRARGRDIPDKATVVLAALRSSQLGQPAAVTAACAVTVRSLIALITVLHDQVKTLQGQLDENLGRHPDAEIYRSHRYANGKARRNYAATSPITRASGKKKVVVARFVHNSRLVDALNSQAFASLKNSPGARALYDELRAHGMEHNDALRRLANRLVGIRHGCLKARTLCDEATAWGHRQNLPQSDVAT